MNSDTDNPGSVADRTPVSEMRSGQSIGGCYTCAEIESASDRNGKTFLRLRLRDASGEVKAIHFDPSDEALAMCAGDIAVVSGTFSQHPQYGPQVQIRRLRPAGDDDEYDLADLVPVSPVDLGELTERLHALLDSVVDTNLRALLACAFDGAREPGATFAVAPAAVRHHHAYRHGLLEHSLVVAESAADIASRFVSVNRDLVIAGGLLHDIGKTQTYTSDAMVPQMTDLGRLQGEIVLGHGIVQRLINDVPDFPDELAVQLAHIVLSHHGMREKGSPVVPMTREAVIVHYCDDMTARVTAIDEAERATPPSEPWSPRILMLDAPAFFGRRLEPDQG